MKKENPISYNLKIKTIEIIETIYLEGTATTYKEACDIFLMRLKRKNIPTGFSKEILKDNKKFYDNYRLNKHKKT